MALFDFLKPKWKRSDPQARVAGVGGLEDQDILASLAESDPDKSVREAALRRSDEVRPKWQHSQPGVRKQGIATLNDQNALGKLAESDPDESVRQAASERLEQALLDSLKLRLGEWNSRENSLDRANERWDVCQERAKALVRDLSSQNAAVRLRVMEELSSLGIRATYHPMDALQILQLTDSDERVRRAAHETIVQILISALRDSRDSPSVWDSTTIMRAAARGFQGIIDPRSVEPLMSLLVPEVSGYVHREAITALGKQKEPKAAGVLSDLLSNEEFAQEYAYIAQALREIGDEAAIRVAIEHKLLHRDETVNGLVWEAVDALLKSEIFKYEKFDAIMSKIMGRPDGYEAIPVFLSQLSRWSMTYSHLTDHLAKYLSSLDKEAVGFMSAPGYLSSEVQEAVKKATGALRPS